MKKRFLFIVTLLTLLSVVMVSCASDTPDAGNQNGNSGDLVDNSQPVYNIVSCSSDDGESASKIFYAMSNMNGLRADFYPESNAAGKYEIVIGNTSREITQTAYKALERIDVSEEYDARYLVYSDGRSVAIVYDDDIFNIGVAKETAVEKFIDEYINNNDVFSFSSGVLFSGVCDSLERRRELDAEGIEQQYAALRAQVLGYVNDQELADKVTSAVRDYLSLMTPNMISWAANLYDPETGGFYYSNSARNTVGYLPDLESTGQMLALLSDNTLGLMNHVGGSAGFPDWMKEQLAAFAKPLQRPNGFFYHPQWGGLEDSYPERRGRDQSWALTVLSVAGVSPTYTVGTRLGDGMLIDGTRVDANGNVITTSKALLTSKLCGRNIASAVSKVLVASSSSYVSPDLATEEAFRNYLEEGDIRRRSYGFGNQLAARTDEMLRREKQLKEQGAGWSIGEILIEYLKENQNPENGTWYWEPLSYSDRSYYEAVNGLLKTGGLYTAFGEEMPYALEACKTAINGIYSNEEPIHVCDIYNPWFAVQNVFKNLNSCASDKETAKAQIAEIRRELLLDAPNAILKTAEKVAKHKKPDGSFSYLQNSSSPTSQHMQVAVKDTNEGDVNATIIAYVDIANRMFDVLGITRPHVLGQANWYEFVSILEELEPVIKDDDNIAIDPITFDDEKAGVTPDGFATDRCSHPETMITIPDERHGKDGMVFQFKKTSGAGDSLRITSSTGSLGATCLVYESELLVASGGTQGYVAQINLGEAYMLGLRVDSERVHIFDSSTASSNRADYDFCYSVPLDTWFKLRVEYYYGDHDTVRIKVYANTTLKDVTENDLIAVSDNYYDYYGTKLDNGVGTPSGSYSYLQIVGMTYTNLTILMDNVVIGKNRTPYERSNKNLPLNVDYYSSEELLYEFDDLEEGEQGYENFLVNEKNDTVTVVSKPTAENAINKLLSLKGNKGTTANSFNVEIPVNARDMNNNCTVFETKLNFASVESGTKLSLALRQRGSDFLEYSVAAFHLKVTEEKGIKYLTILEAPNGTSGAMVEGVKVELDETLNFRMEYYADKLATLFYIDGKLLGKSSSVSAGAQKRNVGKIEIVNLATGAFELEIDDLKLEKIQKSFDVATKPDIDRIVHSFSGEDPDVTLKGAQIRDGKAHLESANGSVTVNVNKRSVMGGAVVFEAQINSANGTFTVTLLDSNGKEVLKYEIVSAGGVLSVYEVTEKGVYEVPIASISIDGNVKLVIEWYITRDVVQVYAEGQCIALSALQYNETAISREVVSANILLKSGSLILDDLVLESYNKYYAIQTLPDAENTEDAAEVITFESSNSANLPKAITTTLKSGGASVKVDEVVVAGKATKALVVKTQSGDGDSVDVAAVKKKGAFDCFVFEADICFNSTGSLFLYFYNGSTGVYRINLNIQSRVLHIDDNPGTPPYGTMGNPVTTVACVDWFKLRIELFNTNGNSVNARIAVNGVYFADSTEPSWQGLVSNITRLQMTTSSTSVGELMLDNVYLGPGNKTIEKDAGGGDNVAEETESFTNSSVSSVGGGVTNSTVSVTLPLAGSNGHIGESKVTVEDKGDGDKYLRLNTKGYNDVIKILPTHEPVDGFDAFVFESDFRFDTYTVINLFGTDSSPDAAKRVYLYPDGSRVGYEIAGTWGKTDIIKTGEWFKLRIEYLNTEAGNLVIKVYANGSLVAEVVHASFKNDFNSIKAAYIYTFSNSNGNIDFDNIRFGKDVKLETELVDPDEPGDPGDPDEPDVPVDPDVPNIPLPPTTHKPGDDFDPGAWFD